MAPQKENPCDNKAALQRSIEIQNNRGLHARAAAKFVTLVEQFPAEIEVEKGGTRVSGASIMGLMMLAAGKGATITVHASGEKADEALTALTELVENGFGES